MRSLTRRIAGLVPTTRKRVSAIGALSLIAGAVEATAIVAIVGTAVRGDRTSVRLIVMDVSPVAAIVLALVASLLLIALHVVVSRLTATLSGDVLRAIRTDVLDAYRHATWERQSIDRESAILESVSTLAQRSAMLVSALSNGISTGLAAVALIVVAVAADPLPALGASVSSVVLVAAMRPLAGRTRRLANAFQGTAAQLADQISQYASMAREFRAFGVDEFRQSSLESLNDESASQYTNVRYISRVTSYAFKDLAIVLLALAVAALYATGSSNLAALGAVVLLLIRAVVYAQSTQTSYQVLMEEGPALARLSEHVESLRIEAFVRGSRALEGLQEVRFVDVSYRYPDGRWGLKRTNLTIRRGEFVGIIGPSGGGKSTLLELLLGLREPTTGAVTINGIPLTEISQDSWSRVSSFVPQEPRLLRGSILENIVFGRPWVSDVAARTAISAAHLDPDIAELPDGLHTELGPRGIGMSGGQQQRLSIARALAGQPDLLVLDEPTSALDSDAERAVKRAIDEVGDDITLVVVAHRLSTLESCDRVLAMHDGTVVSDADLTTAAARLRELGTKLEAGPTDDSDE